MTPEQHVQFVVATCRRVAQRAPLPGARWDLLRNQLRRAAASLRTLDDNSHAPPTFHWK